MGPGAAVGRGSLRRCAVVARNVAASNHYSSHDVDVASHYYHYSYSCGGHFTGSGGGGVGWSANFTCLSQRGKLSPVKKKPLSTKQLSSPPCSSFQSRLNGGGKTNSGRLFHLLRRNLESVSQSVRQSDSPSPRSQSDYSARNRPLTDALTHTHTHTLMTRPRSLLLLLRRLFLSWPLVVRQAFAHLASTLVLTWLLAHAFWSRSWSSLSSLSSLSYLDGEGKGDSDGDNLNRNHSHSHLHTNHDGRRWLRHVIPLGIPRLAFHLLASLWRWLSSIWSSSRSTSSTSASSTSSSSTLPPLPPPTTLAPTMSVGEYVRAHGYGCEDSVVRTADGFHLVVHHLYRVVGDGDGDDVGDVDNNDNDRSERRRMPPTRPTPVLMVHGLLQSAGVFVTSGHQSYAFWMLQQG